MRAIRVNAQLLVLIIEASILQIELSASNIESGNAISRFEERITESLDSISEILVPISQLFVR